ncbi:MAG: hypothetical protein JWN46_670 [Acidimicrobiales bacterium]|nr:hypothetical protein [Acidimicrobiales bacterium]
MRRALPVLGLTAAGLSLVLRFHSSPATAHHVTAPIAAGLRPTTPLGPDGTAPTTAPPTTTGTVPGGSPAPSTTAPPASGAFKNGTFAGSAVDTRYGPVQVQVIVTGGRITDVQELQAPSDRNRSVEINSQAAPLLRDEVLTAQSATIDLVSGATVTWEGYQVSLQAALDAAKR